MITLRISPFSPPPVQRKWGWGRRGGEYKLHVNHQLGKMRETLKVLIEFRRYQEMQGQTASFTDPLQMHSHVGEYIVISSDK